MGHLPVESQNLMAKKEHTNEENFWLDMESRIMSFFKENSIAATNIEQQEHKQFVKVRHRLMSNMYSNASSGTSAASDSKPSSSK